MSELSYFDDLCECQRKGHKLIVVSYGKSNKPPERFIIECEDCNKEIINIIKQQEIQTEEININPQRLILEQNTKTTKCTLEKAKQFLIEYLNIPIENRYMDDPRHIIEKAKEQGIPASTIYKARKELGIVTFIDKDGPMKIFVWDYYNKLNKWDKEKADEYSALCKNRVKRKIKSETKQSA